MLSFLKFVFFILIVIIIFNAIEVIHINSVTEMSSILFLIIITIIMNKNRENLLEFFMSPLGYNYGLYSDIELKSNKFYNRKALMPHYNYKINHQNNSKDCSWLRYPCNTKLRKNIFFVEPNGVNSILKNNKHENKLLPPVDGKSKTHKKMFLLTYNKCSPECCPSTYSCSNGCVCLNQDQRDYINSRGKNRIPKSKHNLNF